MNVVHVFYSQCLVPTVVALLVVLTFERVMADNEVEGTETSKCDKCQASGTASKSTCYITLCTYDNARCNIARLMTCTSGYSRSVFSTPAGCEPTYQAFLAAST